MSVAARETHGFQAEVQKLLHLMIHSLYSNREIFLRELISNASDAADRLRFEALAEPALLEPDPELKVRVEYDPAAKTVSVTDNGIGMTREEVIRQLGTIARSGTGDFISQLSGEQKKDANLIGQFGVGFYSAFIVADRVVVETRRAGTPESEGVHWESDGQGEYSVETIERGERGTRVTLHLREDAAEFADEFRLRSLIRKYSDHIAFPVLMSTTAGDGDGDGEAKEEAANQAKALWTRPRTEISDDEYKAFYRHVSHDFQEPLTWSHNKVEGKREYVSLLYVPARAPWDLWNRSGSRGLKLYVKRVFIMDDAEQFLPLYLRFIRGVVDSGDLSLNVSRELLQQDAVVESMKAALTKRVLDMLDKLAKDDAAKYATFWKEFGRVIKEGPAEDHANREKIAGLLRFSTTHTDNSTPDQSLADYIGRRKDGQADGEKIIWYLTADSFTAAKSSPHLEVFRKKGIEVMLLTDTIDEWLIGHLGDFDGHEFRDVKRGELALDTPAEGEGETPKPEAAEHGALIARLKQQLEQQVQEVRTTTRLSESAACLVLGENEMGAQMRKLLQSTGQSVPEAKPILEINPEHPLLVRLAGESDTARFADLAQLLVDEAHLAEGGQLADPGAFVQRLNRLLLGQ